MMEKENFNVVDIFGENVFNDSVMQFLNKNIPYII